MQQQSFPATRFKTQRAVRAHLQPAVKLLNEGESQPIVTAVMLGPVIDKYEMEYLPTLTKSTRNKDGCMLGVHVRPRWGNTLIADIRPMLVDAWLKELPIKALSKGRARRMLKQLIDKAMYWDMVPKMMNPITLVKVKGVTKRVKKIEILTIQQVRSLIQILRSPYNLMVWVAPTLGLRASEAVALQWVDFDFEKRTVMIRRAYTHAALKEVKTKSSEAKLPVSAALLDALVANRTEGSQWVFPSPRKDGPYSSDTILAKHIQPAAKSLEMPRIGWHTFRHSYKSWLASGPATLTQAAIARPVAR